ncbi:Putative ribonuclease H protein At1g65750 [Linum perenne]
MTPPRANRGEDGWAWSSGKDGKFTIKAAYELVANVNSNTTTTPVLWKKIWGWKGPNRVRHFLWLAGNDRLLTNEQRVKRRHAADPNCSICPGHTENTVHILRDFQFAAEVWRNAAGFDQNNTNWTGSLEGWLGNFVATDQSLLFGTVCWAVWKARNARIFTDTNVCARSVANRATVWVKTIAEAMRRNGRTMGPNLARRIVDITWDPGPSDWMTVNTDGTVDPISGRAAAGGLIRNAAGHCVSAFSMNIGCCSITRAELRGAITGLRTAWDLGFRKVEVQVDSMAVLALVNSAENPVHQHTLEVLDIHDLLRKDWEVKIRHVYREGNRAADFLADMGFRLPPGVHSFPTTDVNLGFYLRYDCTRVTEPRMITLND